MSKKLNIMLFCLCISLSLVFLLIEGQFNTIKQRQKEIEPNLDNYAAAEILILSLERAKSALIVESGSNFDDYLTKLKVFESKVRILNNRSRNESTFYHDTRFLELEDKLMVELDGLKGISSTLKDGGASKIQVYNYIEGMKPLLIDIQEAIYNVQIRQFNVVKNNIADNYKTASLLSLFSIILVVLILIFFVRNTLYLKSIIRNKNLFISAIYHELASSIQSILMAADIMGHEVSDQRLRNDINVISSNASNIMEQTREIMDYAKIEMNKHVVNKVKFNLTEVIKITISELDRTNENRVQFYASSKAGLIYSDKYKLTRLFVNILDNANKNTLNGLLTINVKVIRGDLYLLIKDSGSGFDVSNIDFLFKAFNQGAEHKTKQGLGLGLTIVKCYVDSLGGRLSIKSSIGVGSSFLVYIPKVSGKE